MKMAHFPLFFFFLVSQAQAQWKFSGNAGPYVNALGFPSTSVSPTTKTGVITELRLDRKADQWKVKSELFFRTDALAKDGVENFQFVPKNFYVQRKFSSLVFRLGYQTLSIDGPDVVNPADIVHSKNWIDPTSPITMGSAGLSMSQEIGKWNWEVFYIPYQTAPVLPGEHSPWLPRKNRLPIESNNLEIRIPDNQSYQYQSGRQLNHALANNFTAKVQRKSENLETQVIYYEGLSQTPFVLTRVGADLIQSSPTQILQVTSTVKLIPLYYRQQALAGTFLIPLNSWSIKGGMNWVKPVRDYRVPGETTTAVVGVEKNYETSLGMVTGIFQYIHQQRLVSNQISFLRSFFERAWSAGLRVPFGEETSVLLGGIYDTVGDSYIYRFSANHRLTSSWSVEAGAQFLDGPKKTLVGLYDRYDSYQIKALYYW
jgi:hypothetical protein